jgi:hypothetical protein
MSEASRVAWPFRGKEAARRAATRAGALSALPRAR